MTLVFPKIETRKAEMAVRCAIIAACVVLYTYWAAAQPFNFSPDEAARYMLSSFIFENNSLPTGWDASVSFGEGGGSFAFRLTFLPSILQATGMKIASIFSSDAWTLLMGARLASVFCGVATVIIAMKISNRLFNDSACVRILLVTCIAFMPQFAYLSSYVNSDIVCVLSTAIMTLAWLKGLDDGWNWKTGLLLSLGLIACLLSYYNGYGWIIASIVLALVSAFQQQLAPKRFLSALAAAAIPTVLVFSFFAVRNAMLYNGDVLGLTTLLASYTGTPAPDAPGEMGYPLVDFLLGKGCGEGFTGTLTIGNWFEWSLTSAIGYFGYMNLPLGEKYYWVYYVLLVTGLVLALVRVAVCIIRRKTSKRTVLLYACLGLATLLTFGVSLYFSYATSWQPQGRYLYPAFIPIMIFIVKGYDGLMRAIGRPIVTKIISGGLCLAFLALLLRIYILYTPLFVV